ncbi:Keratin, type II cuticular Hb4 [Wickerhamomyces ciferrii]|uniref:Keratin, type II cuticular Hb4 n=1 Tax=Wickerhamomyces ciferrii (strain ATCC 14091 / BCRC 22168 / CBS 111 / JCM 3599 / NBRC 0793 / NRRL Y-1031 F-60-10) TaxID=1206466 RepID=K0KWI5_WICCF|nr:Keratin, type II cuticular Hb4 [Wickerhamomyces ciferrii]CCH45503.1 Keratin, type II cuticular Hb4 [Wickerhamomyces ciferrii]
MFKIKIPASKDKIKDNAKETGEKKKKLPKLKIAKPQPPTSQPPSSAPSSSSSNIKLKKTKAKQIKVKLKTPLPGIAQPVVKKAPRIRVKPTRIPGEGYDSEASDIEDDPLVEEAIILRLLPDAELDYVRHCVESGEFNQFHIKWKDRLRAIVYINYSMYAAKLVNLPNIIEAQKTVDKKNIFKTIDISQILLVVRKIQNESEIEDLQVEYGEVLPDGLTPPLQKVTESRHRRKLTNDYIEKIESKVDELLKLDEEAEDSQFELIDPESLNVNNNDTPAATPSEYSNVESFNDIDSSAILKSGNSTYNTESNNNTQFHLSSSAGKDHDEDLELELEQALGGDFSLENGQSVQIEDSNGEKLGQIVADKNGNGGEEEEEEEVEEELEIEEEEETEESDDDDDDDDNSDNDQAASRKVEVDEDAQHNALLKDEINELLTTIEQNKSRLEKTHNPLLQSRFIDSINKLEKELENKKRQLKTSEDKTANNKKNDEDDLEDGGSGNENEDRENEVRNDDDEEEEEEEDGDNDDDIDDLFG